MHDHTEAMKTAELIRAADAVVQIINQGGDPWGTLELDALQHCIDELTKPTRSRHDGHTTGF